MAKNFSGARSTKAFAHTRKAEQEKATVIALQNITDDDLIDNPKNGEDITMTVDLEESMKQNGFTDPIEVTDFGMEDGKYMILSGHRRRAAGVKVGITVFPCLVRHFTNEQEVQNYTLMANSQRDSAKDPCLFCSRYKLHEQYLESIGFKGSKREEIAKRLGISVQQADRYNAMNKIILPVWDMVRAEQVGMSSVQPMAKHTETEQLDIYNIMQDALKDGVILSRDTVKVIVDGYRNGKVTWTEIAENMENSNTVHDSGLPLNGFVNTEPSESKDENENRNRNEEVRQEYDIIGAEQDKMDADRESWEQEQEQQQQSQEQQEDETEEYNEEESEKHSLSPEEKQVKIGEEIAKQLSKLDTNLQSIWKCESKEKAKDMIVNMGSVVQILIDELYRVSEEWDTIEEAEKVFTDVTETVKQYQ